MASTFPHLGNNNLPPQAIGSADTEESFFGAKPPIDKSPDDDGYDKATPPVAVAPTAGFAAALPSPRARQGSLTGVQTSETSTQPPPRNDCQSPAADASLASWTSSTDSTSLVGSPSPTNRQPSPDPAHVGAESAQAATHNLQAELSQKALEEEALEILAGRQNALRFVLDLMNKQGGQDARSALETVIKNVVLTDVEAVLLEDALARYLLLDNQPSAEREVLAIDEREPGQRYPGQEILASAKQAAIAFGKAESQAAAALERAYYLSDYDTFVSRRVFAKTSQFDAKFAARGGQVSCASCALAALEQLKQKNGAPLSSKDLDIILDKGASAHADYMMRLNKEVGTMPSVFELMEEKGFGLLHTKGSSQVLKPTGEVEEGTGPQIRHFGVGRAIDDLLEQKRNALLLVGNYVFALSADSHEATDPKALAPDADTSFAASHEARPATPPKTTFTFVDSHGHQSMGCWQAYACDFGSIEHVSKFLKRRVEEMTEHLKHRDERVHQLQEKALEDGASLAQVEALGANIPDELWPKFKDGRQHQPALEIYVEKERDPA